MNRSEGYFIEFRMKPIDTRALSAYKKDLHVLDSLINKHRWRHNDLLEIRLYLPLKHV